jgi:4-amino-4-deoxy-L-arabinose transferase-like glycosyltransferase
MNRKLHQALLLLVLILAGFLRFYRLNDAPPGLHEDEATDGNDAWEAWRSGHFRVFYPENHGREGLSINLQAVVLGVTGSHSPGALRWAGALLGTLTVLGVYALAREVIGEEVGLLAAFLLAISFWHINISRFGTRPVAAPCFLVWSLVLLWLAVRRLQRGVRDGWVVAIACGVVYGLGFYTYTPYRLTPLLLLAVFVVLKRDYGSRSMKNIAAIVVWTASVVIVPLLLFSWRHPAEFFQRFNMLAGWHTANPVGELIGNTMRTAAMFFWAGDTNPLHNIPGRALLFWPVGLLFVFGLGVTIRRQRWLLVWIIIGLLPAIIANEGIPHAWRSILAAPAVFIVAAQGGMWLWERVRRSISLTILQPAALVVGGLLVVEAYRSYFVVWANDPQVVERSDRDLLEIATRLNSLPHDPPKYVVLTPDTLPDVPTIGGLPLAAQTIMYLTDTATTDRQREKNLYYLLPNQTNEIVHPYECIITIERAYAP